MAGAQPARAYAPSGSRISAAFGAPLSLDPYSDARLRREQADFERTRREISRQNAWMAVPALAPETVVAGLGLAGALGVRGLRDILAQYPKKPLHFVERGPFRFNGDNRWARIGREKHAEFRDRVRQKQGQGWDAEKAVQVKGGYIRPDAMTPIRSAARTALGVDKRFYIGLKPDTPSGRLAGAREVRRYEKRTGNKPRIVYYKP